MLLAILRDDSLAPPVSLAALYDPQADRVMLVREGDQILGRTVLRVRDAWAELGPGNAVVRLTLDAGGHASR